MSEIQRIYAENKGRVGYRRITLELHQQGRVVNHKTVQRLMRLHGIVCCVRMKKYKSYKGEVGKTAPNLLERSFEAPKPNQKWVTDVTEMLEHAFETIPGGTNLILHSDQGWQYQHKQYQQMLKAKGVRQSMSRKGNCLDNAVIENFFGLLKSELLYLQKFDSMEHFKAELIDYLDYYNNRRIKAKLKGLPPAIHRLQALSAA